MINRAIHRVNTRVRAGSVRELPLPAVRPATFCGFAAPLVLLFFVIPIEPVSPYSALWTFPAILLAALILAWAAESAQFFVSQGLALALLAWLQTLPEFAVEAVIAWKQQTELMVANLTSEYATTLPMAKAMALVEARPTMNVALSPYGVTNEARTTLGKAMETILGQAANVKDAINAAATQIRNTIKSGVEASKAR